MTDLPGPVNNPYAAPQAESAVAPASLYWNPGVEVRAERVRLGNYFAELYRRRIQLSGGLVGVVEWREMLDATVSVNDVVYSRQRNLAWEMVPRFEIPVMAGRPSTLVVEVRSRNWHYVWCIVLAFRIRLGERTLYSEGEWPADPPGEGSVDGGGASPPVV